MKKSGFIQEFVKPVLVLTLICTFVALLLGLTNKLTAPIISENQRIEAENTRKEVLPGAESFTEIPFDSAAYKITGAYKEESGLGYVFTAANKGYGGIVTVTVGIDNSGKIVGISANVGTETTGIGSKAGQEAYTGQFLGLSGNASSVDTISGATYSSSAVKNGVNQILEAYTGLIGGNK